MNGYFLGRTNRN